MAISRQLLAIIGRRRPAIFDVFPDGPLSVRSLARYSEVALNPQPLPPHELGAAVAGDFIQTAWLADRFGLDLGVVLQELEDWCPTPPRRPKLPPWWPPIPDPEPGPDWVVDLHLGFAARLAGVSAAFEGSRLGEAVDKAIERSLEAIESTNR